MADYFVGVYFDTPETSLMHYGRRGMKRGMSIFGDGTYKPIGEVAKGPQSVDMSGRTPSPIGSLASSRRPTPKITQAVRPEGGPNARLPANVQADLQSRLDQKKFANNFRLGDAYRKHLAAMKSSLGVDTASGARSTAVMNAQRKSISETGQGNPDAEQRAGDDAVKENRRKAVRAHLMALGRTAEDLNTVAKYKVSQFKTKAKTKAARLKAAASKKLGEIRAEMKKPKSQKLAEKYKEKYGEDINIRPGSGAGKVSLVDKLTGNAEAYSRAADERKYITQVHNERAKEARSTRKEILRDMGERAEAKLKSDKAYVKARNEYNKTIGKKTSSVIGIPGAGGYDTAKYSKYAPIGSTLGEGFRYRQAELSEAYNKAAADWSSGKTERGIRKSISDAVDKTVNDAKKELKKRHKK